MKSLIICALLSFNFVLTACEKKPAPLPVPMTTSQVDDFADLKEKKEEKCAKDEALVIPNPQENVKLQGGDGGCKI